MNKAHSLMVTNIFLLSSFFLPSVKSWNAKQQKSCFPYTFQPLQFAPVGETFSFTASESRVFFFSVFNFSTVFHWFFFSERGANKKFPGMFTRGKNEGNPGNEWSICRNWNNKKYIQRLMVLPLNNNNYEVVWCEKCQTQNRTKLAPMTHSR